VLPLILSMFTSRVRSDNGFSFLVELKKLVKQLQKL